MLFFKLLFDLLFEAPDTKLSDQEYFDLMDGEETSCESSDNNFDIPNQEDSSEIISAQEKSQGPQTSIEYLEAMQASLQDNSWLTEHCESKFLLFYLIQTAHHSINQLNIDNQKVFTILLDIIEKLLQNELDESTLLSQDCEGNTVLHWSVKMGDTWKVVTQRLLLAYPEACLIQNKAGKFPLGLAADTGACDTFMMLMDYTQDSTVWVQCLQPFYQKKFEHYRQEEVELFSRDNPDPNKVKVPFLVAKNENWRKAYDELKTCLESKASDNEKEEQLNQFLGSRIASTPKHLHESFYTKPSAIYLFIIVSCPTLFDSVVGKAIENALLCRIPLNPNVSYYLLNTYGRYIRASLKASGNSERDSKLPEIADSWWYRLRPEVALYLLFHSDQFSGHTKTILAAGKLPLLTQIAVTAGVPQEEISLVLRVSVTPKRFLINLKKRINQWARENAVVRAICSIFAWHFNKHTFLEEYSNYLKKYGNFGKALSEETIEALIKDISRARQLMEPTDQNGNTVLHLACFYEARITITALLRQIADASYDPKQAIEDALATENKDGQTPYEFCSSEFADELKNTIIFNLLQENSTSCRLNI